MKLTLAEQTWIFGEEYNLTVDDESLTSVLDKHLTLLGRDPVAKDAEVSTGDGKRGIIDLMLSRTVPQHRADEREHLIVELKRPTVRIGLEEITQVQRYAFAVADDERFSDTQTKWVFWAVSNNLTPEAQRQARQSNRAPGMVHDDEERRLTIWVRPWSVIIEESRARLEFFRSKLQYIADRDSGLEFLRRTHNKYLPKVAADASPQTVV